MGRPKPLHSRGWLLRRLGGSVLLGALLIAGALAIGVGGYHFIAKLGWVDATLNASMILAGMGPVDTLHDDASKLFASAYAIFSGVAFLGTVGVVLSPLVHRFLHQFNLELDDARKGRGPAE